MSHAQIRAILSPKLNLEALMLKKLVVLFLAVTITTLADGNSFDRVRYNGGSVDSKVDPKDWHNNLTIT